MDKIHRIALMSAGLMVGAQVGLAALTTETPDADLQAQSMEGQEIAATDTSEPKEIIAEATVAVAPEEPAPAERISMGVILHSGGPHFNGIPASAEETHLLPALAAYLERTEHLRFAGASGSMTPADGESVSLLPVLASYLDQRDTARMLAEAPPTPPAGESVTTLAVVTPEPREVVVIEASPR